MDCNRGLAVAWAPPCPALLILLPTVLELDGATIRRGRRILDKLAVWVDKPDRPVLRSDGSARATKRSRASTRAQPPFRLLAGDEQWCPGDGSGLRLSGVFPGGGLPHAGRPHERGQPLRGLWLTPAWGWRWPFSAGCGWWASMALRRAGFSRAEDRSPTSARWWRPATIPRDVCAPVWRAAARPATRSVHPHGGHP